MVHNFYKKFPFSYSLLGNYDPSKKFLNHTVKFLTINFVVELFYFLFKILASTKRTCDTALVEHS